MNKHIATAIFVMLSVAVPQAGENKHDIAMTESSEMVYICTGPGAEKYHANSSCRGLRRCLCAIKKVTVSEAKKSGFKPCKICY